MTVSAVEYAPGGVCGPRTQQDVQLVMLDRGSLRLTADGVEQAVEPGEVVCQWPGTREHYAFDPDAVSAHRWIALTFDGSTQTQRWLAGLRVDAPRIRRESSAMRQLFDTAMAMSQTDAREVQIARAHLGWAYFAAYLIGNAAARTPADAPLPAALLSMRSAIAENYAKPMTLDDLADAGLVSANHLVRLCRKHLDTTPMRMLWDSRVDHGVALLRSTGLNIGEIAYRVGFANPFHFSRLCKAKYGISPRKLRQQAWADG